MAERLQKLMARSGVSSRRGAEVLILAGRVTVNGRVAQLGWQVDGGLDEVRVDGERIEVDRSDVHVLVHKPVGVVCSLRAQGGRRTVRQLVDLPDRLFPVGRLDVDSEGLVLLTNDGRLAHRITHPRYGCEKEYRVLLDRRPSREQMASWRRGVVLDDGRRTLPARVNPEVPVGGDESWMRVILRQGMKRQIRRTAQALGLNVRRLIRVRIGNVSLGNLAAGEWRSLAQDELAELRSALGLA